MCMAPASLSLDRAYNTGERQEEQLPPLDNDMERTPPQTESTRERGFDADVDEDQLGEAEAWEDDDIGDIADEGPGHRG